MNLDKIFSTVHQEVSQLQNEGRFGEYILISEQLSIHALNTLGLSYCNNKRFQKALDCFNFGLNISPANWLLWSNICHVYSLLEEHQSALNAAQKASFYSDYQFFDPIYNMAVSLTALGKFEEAKQAYEMSLRLNPNHNHSNYNLGLIYLRNGQFKEGWDKYEWRFSTNEFTGSFKKRFIQDEWDGRSLKKKKILIYNEQGIGDFIFFSRFIPLVKKLGAYIILEIQEPLIPIISDNLKVDEVVSRPSLHWPNPPKSDYCISVNSLPRVLKIHSLDQVKSEPYFFAPKKPKPKGFSKNKLKVGICWSGNRDHSRDHTRSIHLETFRPLADKCQLFGLGKKSGLRNWPKEIVNLDYGIENFPFINLDNQLGDFKDLAHFINHLDLVITVDTSVAHLCGAMGKPVWMLIGKETDWRWMEGNTTPWYPSMKIFRNTEGWPKLIEEVCKEL